MLLWIDGFDHYGPNASAMLDGVYSSLEGVTLVNQGARTGLRAARVEMVVNNSGLRRVLPGKRSVVGLAFGFNISALPTDPSSMALAQFLDEEGKIISTLTVLPTGSVQFRKDGRAGEVVGTSAPTILPGAYQHFECEVSGSSGAAEVRINGVTILSTASSGATGEIAQVMVAGCYGYPKTGALGISMLVDDLACRDNLGTKNNGWIGDQKCYTRFPDQDGLELDWLPSEGVTSWPMLDNVPPLDATQYLQASEAGKRTAVGIASFPTEIVAISGVYTATRLWKTDAGNAKVAVDIISGGVETSHNNHPISTRPAWYGDITELNPSTGAPWLVTEINAAEVLLERIE